MNIEDLNGPERLIILRSIPSSASMSVTFKVLPDGSLSSLSSPEPVTQSVRVDGELSLFRAEREATRGTLASSAGIPTPYRLQIGVG